MPVLRNRPYHASLQEHARRPESRSGARHPHRLTVMETSRTESTSRPLHLSPARLAALLVFIPTALGLLTFAYRYLDYVANGVSRPALAPLVEEMTGHYGGVLLLAPAVFLAWRIGLSRRPWPERIAFHVTALPVYAVLHTTFNWLAREALFPLFGLGDYDYGILRVRYAMELPKEISSYVLVFVIAGLFERYRTARDRELRTSELEARLARAQLHNLQAQLNPHFVFNALNTISSVMYEDVDRADHMLAGLSDLLRRALHASSRHEVTLAEELEVLGIYLDIMRARFGDRLHVEIAVDDDVASALVPTLLLQPLVENALHHGAPPPPEPAKIEVRVRRDGDSVRIEVEDNGPGLSGAAQNEKSLQSAAREGHEYHGAAGVEPAHDTQPLPAPPAPSPARPHHPLALAPALALETGIGLSNTAARLRGLYGTEQSLTLGTGRLGGLCVAIRIPYHLESGTVSAAGALVVEATATDASAATGLGAGTPAAETPVVEQTTLNTRATEEA